MISLLAINYEVFPTRPDPTWIVIGHCAHIFFIVFMIRSGLGIFSASPKCYLADDCSPGKEWLGLTRMGVSAGVGHSGPSFDTEDVWKPGDHLAEPPEPRPRPALALHVAAVLGGQRARLHHHVVRDASPADRDGVRTCRVCPVPRPARSVSISAPGPCEPWE